VVTAYSGYLLEWLHSGDVDIAVVYGTERVANIRISPLLVETLHFVGAGGPVGAANHPLPFAEVAARRLVLPGPRHGLRILVEEEARRRDLALNVVVEADSLQVQKGLVTKGLGSTVLPLASVHSEVAAGLLRASPIVDPHLSRRLVVARPLGRQASNAVRRFGAVLRDEVAEMVNSEVWDGRLLTDQSP
jgi:LysR family transcriptional regulator, nitrogen assimilation regulatory protein